jgi:hypothetical protein
VNADDFVAKCRREWKRLRVPGEIADEMAGELRSDLAEAAADGVPAEELLGAGARDARGFAASWASERGVVPARRLRCTPLLAGAAIAVAGIAIAAGVLSTRSTTPKRPPLAATATHPQTRVVLDPADGRVVSRVLVLQELSQLRRQLRLARP